MPNRLGMLSIRKSPENWRFWGLFMGDFNQLTACRPLECRPFETRRRWSDTGGLGPESSPWPKFGPSHHSILPVKTPMVVVTNAEANRHAAMALTNKAVTLGMV